MITIQRYHAGKGYYPDSEPDLTSEESDFESIEEDFEEET